MMTQLWSMAARGPGRSLTRALEHEREQADQQRPRNEDVDVEQRNAVRLRGDVEQRQQRVVEQQPAEKEYPVSRAINYGNRSLNVILPMPLCANHFAVASKKNRRERLVGQIGVGLGMVAGLGAAIGMLSYWAASHQGNPTVNPFVAAFIGLGVFLAIWVLLAHFVAPTYADDDTKAVREAMKIRHYWPGSQELQLEFASEAAADMVAQNNADRLLRRE